MFNIGPMELLVLAIVGLVILGPDKLPTMAKDAARMLKTLREMANGARVQLREELGPDLAYLADTDPRTLNPRHVIRKAVMGDAEMSDLNPANFFKETMADVKDAVGTTNLVADLKKDIATPAEPATERPVTLEKPAATYDTDAT